MSLDPIAFKKTKHILRAAEFLRDLVARNVIVLQHVPGTVMLADLLTKAVARAMFVELMRLLDAYAQTGCAHPSVDGSPPHGQARRGSPGVSDSA